MSGCFRKRMKVRGGGLCLFRVVVIVVDPEIKEKEMFVSIESIDELQAIQLGTQYITNLCESGGDPCAVRYPLSTFQKFTHTAFTSELKTVSLEEDVPTPTGATVAVQSRHYEEAMIHARALDFLANADSAHEYLEEGSNLVFVNYLTLKPGDYRVHGRGPMPDMVFHIIDPYDKISIERLRLFCNTNGINYIQVNPGGLAEIRLLIARVCTTTFHSIPVAVAPLDVQEATV